MSRLKVLREMHNLNMREVASKIGIPYTTYVNYEKGTREPNSEMLIVLANFYGVTIDYLIGRDENQDNASVPTLSEVSSMDMVQNSKDVIYKIALNLQRLRKKANMSIEQASKYSGLPSKTIIRFEQGLKPPTVKQLFVLANLYGSAVGIVWGFNKNNEKIIETDVEMQIIDKYRALDVHGKTVIETNIDLEYKRMEELREQEREMEKEQKHSENKIIKFERPSIPDYDVPTSAGPGQFLDVSSYKMVTLGKDDPQDASFIVTVKGHSMEPLYRDGDKVFVRQQPGVEVGEIGLFMVDNETYIKEMGYGELISQNPKYPNIKLRDGVSAYCFGKIVGVKKQKPIAMVAAYDSEIKGVHAFESPVTEEELERILEEYNKKIGDTHMDEFD